MSWKTQWFLWRYKFFLAAWNGRNLRKIVWTQSIRLHEQKLPPNQWTKLFYFIKNLNTRLNRAWYFFDILKFVFFCPKLRKPRAFCAKFISLVCELRIIEKPFGSKALRIILLQRHNKCCDVISFSWRREQTVYLCKIFWTQFVCMTKNRPNRLRIKIYGKMPVEKLNILSTYMQFSTQHILLKNIREFCVAIPVGWIRQNASNIWQKNWIKHRNTHCTFENKNKKV